MRDLDKIDREIIRLLLENSRRPYSEIAAHVDLSAPAVRDRIDRLSELGVIRGFTLDLNTELLRGGVGVLIELAIEPGHATAVADALAALDRVEHRFVTADSTVFVHATLGSGGVSELLDSAVPVDRVRSIDVHLLAEESWSPSITDETQLSIDCVECGNTVTSEGETATIDGTEYHFCCGSCLARFEKRYDRFSADA